MKKSLLVLISVVAIALFTTAAFGYGPVLKCLPDVYISDEEVNGEFFFSDAFSFDDYVEDLDTADDALAWAFLEEDPKTNLNINDVGSLSAAPTTGGEIQAADIRGDGLADFHDMLIGDGLIAEYVTFYVTDGSFIDSNEWDADGGVWVESIDNDVDHLISQCVPVVVNTWNFETPPQGWTFFTADYLPGTTGWAHANSVIGAPGPADSIGLNTPVGETTYYFAGWLSPDTITFSADKLWRATFSLACDKADPSTIPSIRLRMTQSPGQKAAAYVRFYPGGWLPLAQSPATTDYELYMKPPIADTSFFLAFEIIDFGGTIGSTTADGSVYLDEVTVDAFDQLTCCIEHGWGEIVEYEGVGLSGWTFATSGEPFLTDVSEHRYDSTAPAGLLMATTLAQSRAYANYLLPAGSEVPLPGDYLYRATFSLVCQDSTTVGTIRNRVQTQDFRFAAYQATEPAADGAQPPSQTIPKDYYVYFKYPAAPPVDAKVFAAWDFYDIEVILNKQGWAKLTKFALDYRDP